MGSPWACGGARERDGSLWAQNVPVTDPNHHGAERTLPTAPGTPVTASDVTASGEQHDDARPVTVPSGPVAGGRIEEVPVTPRAITMAVATVVAALLVAVAAVIPVPYAISSPGPTWDTLGTYDDQELIAVDGAPTYESSGELRLTTVSVAGGPGYQVGLVTLLEAWADRARAVVPVETVYAPEETREEIDERNQAAMISSQENATVAALEELGYQVPTTLTVVEAVEGTGSAGVVEPDDVIVAIDGEPVASFSELSARMDEVEPGSDVVVGVERDGEPLDLTVTTTEEDGRALLGVLIDPEFDLPVDVTIQIENVGGPSAGTMFALGIIDTLTEADETGGEVVAGTGTMNLAGDVGPISGIRQKLVGAQRADAEWFLAPEANCDDVVGYVPDGVRVVSVSTLSEARAAVEAIGAGAAEDLPTCS